jgi:hypothetical protein
MTQRKTTVGARSPRPAAAAVPVATMADLDRAIEELGIDVPIGDARLVAGRLELHLYGGRVVTWPPLPESDAMAPEPADPPKEGD